MPEKSRGKGASDKVRSACPISVWLDLFGDRWSLLVVRDLMFEGRSEFRDFLGAGEGIATNILADRLRRLEDEGVVEKRVHASDARRVVYRLTEKGMKIAPVLVEMILWAAENKETAAPPAMVKRLRKDRGAFLDELLAAYAIGAIPKIR